VTAVWELPPRPPVRRKRVLVVLACALVGAAAVAVVVIHLVHIALEPWHALNAASKTSERELPTIQALPEATLLAPGSRVFFRNASPATILGGGASINSFAGVNASDEQIFAYYRQQLGQRGWQGPDPNGIDNPRWTKGRYAFFLSFAAPGDQTYPDESHYATAYDVGILYLPAAPSTQP
jgi:hypothetical protein